MYMFSRLRAYNTTGQQTNKCDRHTNKVSSALPPQPFIPLGLYNETRITHVEVPKDWRLVDAIEGAPWVWTGCGEVEQMAWHKCSACCGIALPMQKVHIFLRQIDNIHIPQTYRECTPSWNMYKIFTFLQNMDNIWLPPKYRECTPSWNIHKIFTILKNICIHKTYKEYTPS